MGGDVTGDVGRQFRKEGEIFVNVSCKRVWLLRFRMRAFTVLTRIAARVTGLRLAEVTAEVDDDEE